MLEAQAASFHWKHIKLCSVFTGLAAENTCIVQQKEAKINIYQQILLLPVSFLSLRWNLLICLAQAEEICGISRCVRCQMYTLYTQQNPSHSRIR